MTEHPDNEALAAEEEAINERRLAVKGWPVQTLLGEVMVVGEKVINGQRYLRRNDGSLLAWDGAARAWGPADLPIDEEAVPEDAPADTEEPDTSPPILDPLAAEIEKIGEGASALIGGAIPTELDDERTKPDQEEA